MILRCIKPHLPRLFIWHFITLLLLCFIAWYAPQQISVVVYKTCLVILGVVLAYLLDRALYPYARPHSIVKPHQLAKGADANLPDTVRAALLLTFGLVCLRRALIAVACVLGLTMGL